MNRTALSNEHKIFRFFHVLPAAIVIALILGLSNSARANSDDVGDNANQIQEIVVISSRVPVPMNEVIGSVGVIDRSDIDSRMVSDMAQLFATQVGVSVDKRQAYSRMYNDGIMIRGLGGKRVNVLIDGVRVGDTYTGYGRDLVDPELLKRVEILKGPSSALYGSDGLAGVVSYITKDPEDFAANGQLYTSIKTSFDSSSDRVKTGVTLASSQDKLGWILQATRHDMEQSKLHDDASLAPNPMEGDKTSVLAKLMYDLNDSSTLSLTIDMERSESDWYLPTDIGMSFFPSPITNTSESLGTDKTDRERYSITYEFSGETAFFDYANVSAFHQSTDQQQKTDKVKQIFGFGPMAGPTQFQTEASNFEFNQSVEGMSIQFGKDLLLSSGIKHQMVYGLEYEKIEVERPRYKTSIDVITGSTSSIFGGDIYPNKTFPDTTTERSAAYFSDRIEINDHMSLVLGLRYDQYDLKPKPDALFNVLNVARNELAFIDDSAFSGKFGMLYDLTDNLAIFAQYAEGFRSPDYESANLSFVNFAYYYSVAPNPNLESEESSGFEIGLRGGTEDINWSMAFYDTDYEKFIETDLTGVTSRGLAIYQYVNLDEVSIRGFELEMKQSFSSNLSTTIGINRNYGEKNGEKLTSIPPTEILLALDWQPLDDRLSIRALASMIDDGPGNKSNCGRSGRGACLEVAGYTTLDIYADYMITRNLSAKVGVENITDRKYWDWISVDGKSADDPAIDLFLASGREFKAELQYEF